MRAALAIAATFIPAAHALGHHSDAALDMESLVTIEGTVTEFNWRNPHIYFTVAATDESGETVEWEVQMSSTITTSRMGWTRDSLVAGDRVRVGGHPARNGRPYAMLYSIEKEGVPLPTAFDASTAEPLLAEPEATGSTDSLEGIWMASNAELVRYPGGFDGFFRAQLRLTERGAAAQAAYDEFSEENPETQCIGRPPPAMIVSSNLFPMQFEISEAEAIIIIRSQFWDEERTVYMDGRGHPDISQRFPSGHSIGHWEGDTLVVDTANFTDHRSPYQIGVPSGGQKHVVERYRLIEGGTRIAVEFVLEDPEYIAEPLAHARQLIYSPQIEMTPFDCDPETSRRFVTR